MPSTSTSLLDGLSASVAIKAPCAAVTTAAITLSGEQTIGGVSCVAGDRVLVAITGGSVNNGVWIVSTGSWTRAPDWDGARDVVQGTMVLVKPGSVDEQFWVVKTADPIRPGTTSVSLDQHSPEELTLRGELATGGTSTGAAMVAFEQAGTGAVARTVQGALRDLPMSAFDFLSSAQIAVVQAYSYGSDLTTELQAAIDAAFAAGRDLYLPAGGYLVTGLDLPGSSTEREKTFRMYGQGMGEIFATVQLTPPTGGTILKSTTDAPILRYTTDSATKGNGNGEIAYMVVWGSSTTPVIHLDAWYGQSELHHLAVYQASTGNGIQIDLSNTIEIHHCYVLNYDWKNASEGAGRTGIGIYIYQNGLDTGLTTIRKCTSRGFLTGYKLGDASGNNMYSPAIVSCEASTVRNGIHLTSDVEGAVIDDLFCEGGDGGTAILDEGNYNTVRDSYIFTGFAYGIDSPNTTRGSYYSGNTLSVGSVANTILLRIASSGANGLDGTGIGKTAVGNAFTFSGHGGSVAGVKAIQISGTDPRINLSGNSFDPRGEWNGGAGTEKIDDNSTHTDDGSSSGLYGLAVAQQGGYEFPWLASVALSLAKGAALADAAISANVLTVGPASSHVITCSGAQSITSISSTNREGKLLILRTTNANLTFTNGTNLKMSGGSNYTPGANGATLTFLIHSGVAWEVARTAY